MLTGFFTEGPVRNYAEARRADTARYGRFFHAMLERGAYFAPSQFEAAFVSLAHSETDLGEVERAAVESAAAGLA
jgi:glutamate-1-semialdehyde 2,1-aminomutase